MNIIDVLKKIKDKRISEGQLMAIEGMWHKVIVIDDDLYFINENAKVLQLVGSGYISNMIKNDLKVTLYKRVIEED